MTEYIWLLHALACCLSERVFRVGRSRPPSPAEVGGLTWIAFRNGSQAHFGSHDSPEEELNPPDDLWRQSAPYFIQVTIKQSTSTL